MRIFTPTLYFFTALTLCAKPLTTRYGTVAGDNDADQAGPIFGQSITASQGAMTQLPKRLKLHQVSFQASSSGDNKSEDTSLYLQVYEALKVNNRGIPTQIGRCIAVSQNTIDFSKVKPLDTLRWKFIGESIDRDKQYFYILSKSRKHATSSDYTHLAASSFEVIPTAEYKGGNAILANSGRSDWDIEFEVTFQAGPKSNSVIAKAPTSSADKPSKQTTLFGVGNISIKLTDH